jgi:hypothetical protein
MHVRRYKESKMHSSQNKVKILSVINLIIINILICVCNLEITYGSSLKTEKFGAGFVLGDPTGLSGKLWMSKSTALDFGLAFSFNDYFLFFMDHLWHFPGALGRSSTFASQLYPYGGVGGLLAVSTNSNLKDRHFFRDRDSFTALGIRAPIGIEWLPSHPSLGIFIEIAPGIFIIPGTAGLITGGIGARYYF